MTERERIETVLRGERPDRIPWSRVLEPLAASLAAERIDEEPLDVRKNIFAEKFHDRLRFYTRILNGVVQDPRCDRIGIHPRLGKHVTDLCRVDEIWVA